MRKKVLSSTIATVILVTALSVPASASCIGGATISGTGVNFRAGASAGSAVKAVTYSGAPVIVESKINGDWYKVIFNGSEGYIKSPYLKLADALNASFGTAYIAGSSVRLRAEPSVSSGIMGEYGIGTALKITGVYGDWYKVSVSGVSGYVCADYVTFSKPSAAAKISVNQQIVNTALGYVGYPYVYGGASPSGFDCSGFVKYIYGLYGYALDRTASQQQQNGTHVDTSALQAGDILCFANGSYVGHVGIYIGGGKFVHACNSSTGVIVTELDSAAYSGRLCDARRIV